MALRRGRHMEQHGKMVVQARLLDVRRDDEIGIAPLALLAKVVGLPDTVAPPDAHEMFSEHVKSNPGAHARLVWIDGHPHALCGPRVTHDATERRDNRPGPPECAMPAASSNSGAASPHMTDASYLTLPHWPNAYPATGARATLKRLNEDFIVTELPLQLPSGSGEHVWLDIEKNGANTAYVALKLAEAAGLQERDVGYAGLKDRYALTRQWFSLYLPKGETPDFTQIQHPEFKVLSQSRHVKKLRPGDLLGNRFRIVLREVSGHREAIEANLAAVAARGVPNYFGAQRFGHEGGNVEQGRAMLAREVRVRNPKKKGLYLSAVRSFVFNEVLALRIQQGLWGQTLAGDVLDNAGLPTGPMWGRGRVSTTEQAQALEMSIAARHAILCDGMEHAGLEQERRSLVARPQDMSWSWPQDDQLVLTFSLPAGNYATSVLGELLRTMEPERHLDPTSTSDEVSEVSAGE